MMDLNQQLHRLRMLVVIVASIRASLSTDSCPRIRECPSCGDCVLTSINSTGIVTCEVSDLSSNVTLFWEVEERYGFNLTIPAEEYSPVIEIEYTPMGCDGNTLIRCIASDTGKELNQSFSQITLMSEPCFEMEPRGKSGGLKAFLAVLVIAIAILVMVGIWYYWKRSMKEDLLPQKLKVEVSFVQEQPTVSGTRLNRRDFVKQLIKGYKDRELPLSIFPLECDCIMTHDDDVSSFSSTDLLENEIWNISDRVMFLADVGYGKSTMARHLLYRWMISKTDDSIFIYLSLANVSKDASFFDEVIKLLPPKNEDTNNIAELLEQNRCIVLLDGLNEFAMCHELAPPEEYSEYHPLEERLLPSPNNLRVVDLLEGKHHGFPQLTVWATTRQKTSLRGGFREPFCTIHMKGVSKAGKQPFLDKLSLDNKTTNGDDDASEEISTPNRTPDMEARFLQLPPSKDLSFFTKSPMIFALFHKGDTSSNPLLRNVTKLTFTTLVQITLNIFEYRFQQKMHTVPFEDDIENIQKMLCKVALKQTIWKTLESRADGEITQRDIEVALLVGYLKLSINSSGVPSDNVIKFSHDFIQEYFTAWSLDLMENIPSWLQENLKSPETMDPKIKRLLKFLYGFGPALVERITDDLIKSKQWDLLADCLYEVESSDRMENLLSKLHQKKLVFNLEDSEFHFEAVAELCSSCSKKNIKLKAVNLVNKDPNDEKERLISVIRSVQRNVKVLKS